MVDLQFQPLRTLAKAKVRPMTGVLSFYPSLADALKLLPKRNAQWDNAEQDFLHDSGL
jgi:SulP family sulfate permease